MLEADLPQILDIQSANLRENLTPEQQKSGYLSIGFSEDEFRQFNHGLGVIVAKINGKVAGYCCASSATYNAQFPILDQIVSNLSTYKVSGVEQPPKESTTSIYGPACVSAEFRGQGVLNHLFTYCMQLSKAAGYSFCFSFVSSQNQRSLKVHLKLPFNNVGEVSFNDNEYSVLACKI